MIVARSEARTQFLRDIITTAVEGGIGYWSQCSQYQWVDDHEGRVYVPVGERVGDCARAVIHVLSDDESGYVETGLIIDVEVIARGLKLITDGGTNLNDRSRKLIRQADRENDAGYLDADSADVIVQAGLLGEIVYG
jgi:hypothetical protein